VDAQFDGDGLPICPDCGYSLYCDDAGDRDTETMGGYSIEYYYCTHCQIKFEVVHGIEDSIFPTTV
jgi:hypothetical protein